MKIYALLLVGVIAGCGSLNDSQPVGQGAGSITVKWNGDEKTVALTSDDVLRAKEKIHSLRVDNQETDDFSLVVDAGSFELSDENGGHIVVVRDGDLLRIRKDAEDETALRVKWNGKILSTDDASFSVLDKTNAGLTLLGLVQAQVAFAKGTNNANDLGVHALAPAQMCRYMCNELWIGTGLYVCRYFPRGIYYMFQVQYYEFDCYRGGTALNFTCDLFPYVYYARCNGNGA